MKKIATALVLFLSIAMLHQPVIARQAIAKINYNEFSKFYNGVTKIISDRYQDGGSFFQIYHFDMIYPEKKTNYWGEEGKLYFYETLEKNNGVYGSYNSEGEMDAFVVEVLKSKKDAYNFTVNEIAITAIITELMVNGNNSYSEFKQIIRPVVQGTKVYVDYFTKKGFYIRIKNDEIRPDFIRILVSRVDNFE